MADYVTSGQVAAFTHEFASVSEPDLLVAAASRLFDKLVKVPDDFFAEVGGAFADRDFYGDGTAYLKLDPFTELNSVDPVKLNDGTIETPDYSVTNVPEYIVRDGFLVVLDKTKQMPPESASYPNRFQGWPNRSQVRVSAKWGFAAIPADVTFACVHLATHLFRTADPAFAVISNADGAASRIETVPKIAREIINSYREKYARNAAFA